MWSDKSVVHVCGCVPLATTDLLPGLTIRSVGDDLPHCKWFSNHFWQRRFCLSNAPAWLHTDTLGSAHALTLGQQLWRRQSAGCMHRTARLSIFVRRTAVVGPQVICADLIYEVLMIWKLCTTIASNKWRCYLNKLRCEGSTSSVIVKNKRKYLYRDLHTLPLFKTSGPRLCVAVAKVHTLIINYSIQ